MTKDFGLFRFEFVPKNPGFKVVIWWGKEGELAFFFGTNSHRWGKFYFFRDI